MPIVTRSKRGLDNSGRDLQEHKSEYTSPRSADLHARSSQTNIQLASDEVRKEISENREYGQPRDAVGGENPGAAAFPLPGQRRLTNRLLRNRLLRTRLL